MPSPVARTARARARAEITGEILAAARAHLARDGAAGLSLRAVARDCGMASSAIYRYVPSRDALLTLLIVEAYTSLGDAVAAAEAPLPREDHAGRFRAIGSAVRAWALDRPHEYALIYGSPVPGYAAPQDTVAPAARVPALLLAILADRHATGRHRSPRPVPAPVAAAIGELRDFAAGSVPDDLLLRGLAAWGALFGAVSLESFGHLHRVVTDDPAGRQAYFDHQLDQLAADLGLHRIPR